MLGNVQGQMLMVIVFLSFDVCNAMGGKFHLQSLIPCTYLLQRNEWEA